MSARTAPLTFLLRVSLALPFSGCLIYDPPVAIDGGNDAGVVRDDELILSDRCDPLAAPVESLDRPRSGSFAELADDVGSVSACGATELRGPDGFVVLRMAAGERWHISAEPAPDQDIAFYFFEGTCDPRGADCRLFVDRCPAGVEEEITLTSPSARTFFVGFDTHGSAEDFQSSIIKTRCGDEVQEHGEGCDDGNIANGDGCDRICRLELLADINTEAEPNDWHGEANVLRIGAGETVFVTGQVGGLCDQDHFSLEVAEGEELQVTALAPDGSPCSASTNPSMLMLMDPRAGIVMARQMGVCPTLTATLSETGEYHVMYLAGSTGATVPAIPYRLRFDVTAPTPG